MLRAMMIGLLSALMALPSSCLANNYTPEAAVAVKRTGTVVFEPVVPEEFAALGIELEPVVIGSAWAVKDHGDYKIVTAQHVGLATLGVPGVLKVCSVTSHCVEVDRQEGVGPIASTEIDSDWIYWEVDRLPWGMKPSRLADEPTIGEPVCVAGAPLGRVGEYTCGQVTNVIGDMFYVDARIMPGNSGGPVFDAEGRVLGMVIAIDYPVDQGMTPVATSGIAVSAESLWL